MRRPASLLLPFLLASCALLAPAPAEETPAQAAQRRAKAPPPTYNLAGYPPATRDGYIPTAAAQAIHRHWPGSELEWVNGGHGSLLWFHRDRLVEAVARSFERLAAL